MPPSPCEAASTLSVVILRISRNSAALPDCSLRHILHEPVVDPDIGERTAARPSRGTKCNPSHRDHEDETDQQASEQARGGASSSGKIWLSLIRPFGCLMAMTASPSSIRSNR